MFPRPSVVLARRELVLSPPLRRTTDDRGTGRQSSQAQATHVSRHHDPRPFWAKGAAVLWPTTVSDTDTATGGHRGRKDVSFGKGAGSKKRKALAMMFRWSENHSEHIYPRTES